MSHMTVKISKRYYASYCKFDLYINKVIFIRMVTVSASLICIAAKLILSK